MNSMKVRVTAFIVLCIVLLFIYSITITNPSGLEFGSSFQFYPAQEFLQPPSQYSLDEEMFSTYVPSHSNGSFMEDLSSLFEVLPKGNRKLKAEEKISMIRQLMSDSLLMVANENRPKPHSLQIVIATTWRSGSTFLEEFLSSHNGTLDFYEPLMHFKFQRLQDGEEGGVEAQSIIKEILSCKIENENYISTGLAIPDMFHRNKRLWKICKSIGHPSICFNKDFLSISCQMFPFMVVKLVRAGLSLFPPILKDENLNPHIIFLVRDPRAIFNSRTSTVKWCKESLCINPDVFCQSIEKDLDVYLQLSKEYPERLHIIRYEDLSLKPFDVGEELVAKLNWGLSQEMVSFLESHTTIESDTAWTTMRKSAERVMHWTKVMSMHDVEQVQMKCSSIMKRLGYLKVASLNELTLDDVLGDLSL